MFNDNPLHQTVSRWPVKTNEQGVQHREIMGCFVNASVVWLLKQTSSFAIWSKVSIGQKTERILIISILLGSFSWAPQTEHFQLQISLAWEEMELFFIFLYNSIYFYKTSLFLFKRVHICRNACICHIAEHKLMEKSLQVVIINQRCGLWNQGSLQLPGRRSRAQSWRVDGLLLSDWKNTFWWQLWKQRR